MKRIPIVLCLAAALAACAAQAQTMLYKWVDKDGKVQYTEFPPPRDAKNVTEKAIRGGEPSSEEQLPFATQIASRRHPVVLFSSDDCGEYCTQGRELLSKRGIPFSEKNAQRNPADAEALKEAIGALEVPVLMVGTNVVKGYGEQSWHAALDQAGYARTRLPGQAGTRAEQK